MSQKCVAKVCLSCCSCLHMITIGNRLQTQAHNIREIIEMQCGKQVLKPTKTLQHTRTAQIANPAAPLHLEPHKTSTVLHRIQQDRQVVQRAACDVQPLQTRHLRKHSHQRPPVTVAVVQHGGRQRERLDPGARREKTGQRLQQSVYVRSRAHRACGEMQRTQMAARAERVPLEQRQVQRWGVGRHAQMRSRVRG